MRAVKRLIILILRQLSVHATLMRINIDCYQQLKVATNPCSCPFCGNAGLIVAYTEKTRGQKSKVGDEEKNAFSSDREDGDDSNRSSDLENISRSSSTADRFGIPTLSKMDREQLEAQIRGQRSRYQEEDDRVLRSGSSLSNSRNNDSNGPLRFGQRSTMQFPRRNEAGRVGLFGQMESGSRRTPRSPRLNTDAGSRSGNDSPDALDADRDHFISSIHRLITSASTQDRVTSIEQLEEMMLMEVTILSCLSWLCL